MSLSDQIYDARVWLHRRRIFGRLDSIGGIKNRHADFVAVRDRVRSAGTDNLDHFGNGYTHEGGLYLQQNPDEFAALTLFLRERGPYRNYLEIGSASGGACLFLYREVGLGNVISLDDGQHPRALSQHEHFSQIENFSQFRGDSHSDDARRFLEEHVHDQLDVAFIDGDHSYEGVWQDIELSRPFCRAGALMILHDIVSCEDVGRAWYRCAKDGIVKPLAEFVGAEKPLGIAVGAVV
jgi:predicted O-methyltransferase YrrM